MNTNNMENKYVDNDVWKYRIELNWDIKSIEKTIFTKPFPDYYEMPIEKSMKYQTQEKYFDEQEEIVKEKYFTKERIEELKEIFIKRIQESENPFSINCVDTDGGWNVTEEELFSLD